VFGLSFGEILLLLVVGLIVVGPRRLPSMMRTAGQWVAKLRRMSTDLRAQSGIDEIIRQEGLEKEIYELRSLSRVNVIDTIMSPVMSAANAATRPAPVTSAGSAPSPAAPARPPPAARSDEPLREREYPVLGCDSYDALPDDALTEPEPEPEPEPARPAATGESRPAS
jgi:sec-independent protein translocase protein TatB